MSLCGDSLTGQHKWSLIVSTHCRNHAGVKIIRESIGKLAPAPLLFYGFMS